VVLDNASFNHESKAYLEAVGGKLIRDSEDVLSQILGVG